MKLQRFFIQQKIGNLDSITLADEKLCHQLKNVFRYGNNDRIVFFDNSGQEFLANIDELNKKQVVLSILERKTPFEHSIKPELVLYCSLIKKHNFELIVEKCTEIGISSIVPVISERSERKIVDRQRLERIIKEASEQSGRTIIPQLHEILTLKEALGEINENLSQKNLTSLVLEPTSEIRFTDFLKERNKKQENITQKDQIQAFFIGPEGGWSKDELVLFTENNMKLLSLGHQILRAETAAIVSTGLLLLA